MLSERSDVRVAKRELRLRQIPPVLEEALNDLIDRIVADASGVVL